MLIFSSRKRTANGGLASSSSSSDNNDGDDQNTARQPHLNDFYQDAAFNPRKSHDRLNLGLLSLSHTERNKVLEEVHGVRCLAPPESPEMIHDALCRLEKELAKIPPSHKRAYNLAVRRPTTYVTSDDFRLRFLRCELFDTAKAAQRLVNFVELITDKLPFCTPSDTGLYEKPMSLSNLQEREIELYKKGHIQLLPFRDRSGRRVVTAVAQLGIRFDPVMWYKLVLYTLLVAGEDIESQTKGLVIVVWPQPDIANTIQLRYPIHNGGELFQAIIQSVPVRFVAFHFCTPANVPFFNVIKSVFTYFIASTEIRSRVRIHSGEPIELKYQISGYGIPIDLLPITPTGIVKTTYLKQWIKLRVQIEQSIDDVTRTGEDIGLLVECPGSSDVLFRPGKPAMNHIGNVSFRSLIEPLLDVHEQCTQTQKFALVQHVVEELITKRHGRFLTWDNAFGCWRPLADPKKQERKVAIAFRNWKTHRKAQQNRQTMDETKMTQAFQRLDHNTVDDGNHNCATVCQQVIQNTTNDNDDDDDAQTQNNKRHRRGSNS